jgi:hypothetical protein
MYTSIAHQRMIHVKTSNFQFLLQGSLAMFLMLPVHGSPFSTVSRHLLQTTCSDPLMDANCNCPGTLIDVSGVCTCPANAIRASDFTCLCNNGLRPVNSLTTPGLYSCEACDNTRVVSALVHSTVLTLTHFVTNTDYFPVFPPVHVRGLDLRSWVLQDSQHLHSLSHRLHFIPRLNQPEPVFREPRCSDQRHSTVRRPRLQRLRLHQWHGIHGGCGDLRRPDPALP